MLPPPQLHHRIHQSHLVVRQLQDNRFQVAANRMTKSMLSYMVRWCCFRMEGVRLAVRYWSDLHSAIRFASRRVMRIAGGWIWGITC